MYIASIATAFLPLSYSWVGLDQIFFFFYPFCFSFLLKFSTHFAFYHTHFASHRDQVMLLMNDDNLVN